MTSLECYYFYYHLRNLHNGCYANAPQPYFLCLVTYISNKKRNAPLRTVQLSGRSQVLGQFCLYQCEGKSVKLRLLQSGVVIVLKKIGHEQSGGQIVKSPEISVLIMLSCWICSSNWNHLSRPTCTQTIIL